MQFETLQARIAQHVHQQPEKVAIDHHTRQMTYREMEEVSNRIANFFHRQALSNPNILIMLERGPELVTSILGVLKAGAVFVPLDFKYPENRIKLMATEAQAEWIILETLSLARINSVMEELGRSMNVLLVDSQAHDPEQYPCLTITTITDESDEYTYPTENVNKNCYIYFTSGSTGTPKGVLGRHRSLLHFIDWEMREFGVDATFTVSQLTSPSFDPFLRDLFLPLCAGGTLAIPESEEVVLQPQKLYSWIEEKGITLMHMTPSLFKIFSQAIPNGAGLQSLRYIMLAGEKLRGNDIKRFIELCGTRIQLVNLYGPTETTLAKFFYRVQVEDVQKINIPVGKPIDHTEAVILDSYGERCEIGKVGEIHIRTPFISSGYYNRPELTKEVFIKNPFSDNLRDIIYKTGDLGRLMPDRNIELIGRADHQVKIRGIRIEPGEIEQRLLNVGPVKEAIVVAREIADDQYLIAYLVTDREIPAVELRTHLEKDLPEYMIPAYFIRVEEMPLLPNGKVDRNALPQVNRNMSTGVEYTPPTNEWEERLAELWANLLDRDHIGINDNFLAIGGHSLKAITLMARIQETFQVEISLGDIFRAPTVREQARMVQLLREMGNCARLPYQLLNPQVGGNLFCFPPIASHGIAYKEIADSLETHAIYAFDFIESSDPIGDYVMHIREIQPTGPYNLLGYSAGGSLAYAVAERLLASGSEVGSLILMDSSMHDDTANLTAETIEAVIDQLLSQTTDPLMLEVLRNESINRSIRQKIASHLIFRSKLQYGEPLPVDLHYIKAEKKPGQRQNWPDWVHATKASFIPYDGHGTHAHMTGGEFAAKNAEVIAQIISGELSRKN